MRTLFCPSLMCADFAYLKDEIIELQNGGADIFHVDIMDGQYVENFGMGMQDLAVVCKESSIPIEVHLMIQRPQFHVDKFLEMSIDIIYFHPDTINHPAHLIEKIHNGGSKVGIVLNPETSIATVSELLKVVDYVMVMMVNPGFSGNKYLSYVEEKVRDICKLSEKYGFEVEIDGGCSKDVIKKLSAYGANRYVLGTTALFGKGRKYKEVMDDLRKVTEND